MHEAYIKLVELPGFKRYESTYKPGKGAVKNLKLVKLIYYCTLSVKWRMRETLIYVHSVHVTLLPIAKCIYYYYIFLSALCAYSTLGLLACPMLHSTRNEKNKKRNRTRIVLNFYNYTYIRTCMFIFIAGILSLCPLFSPLFFSPLAILLPHPKLPLPVPFHSCLVVPHSP